MKYSFVEATRQLMESEPEYLSPKPLRFIIDAQLPKKLSDFLNNNGFNAVHTLDLPDKNATTDKYIIEFARLENRILITKDDDFLRSFLISKKPEKLILVKTGNIHNNELLSIFEMGITVIISLIKDHPLIEINQSEIIVHD